MKKSKMKVYFLREFKTKLQYQTFLDYMLSNSDVFSFTYCKRDESEKTKKGIKAIADALKKYKVFSKQTNEWPGTVTYDHSLHKLVLYCADINCIEVLKSKNGIYDWLYPAAPEDLCFYKNGSCWLATTSHEKMGFLYTDNAAEVAKLMDMGADLFLCDIEKEPYQIEYGKALNKFNKHSGQNANES